MSWLRIDDGFAGHEKVSGLSAFALQLWIRCGCWCSRGENLVTHGFVPERKVIEFCGGSRARAIKLARELVEAKGEPQYGHEHGLWEPAQGGWKFHDWDQYRPKEEKTAEDVSSKRSEAGKRGAQARWQTLGKQNGNCHGKNDGKPLANHAPDPDPDPDPDPVPPDGGDPKPQGSVSTNDLLRAPPTGDPVAVRARKCLDNPYDGTFSEPHRWPEILAPARAFNAALGRTEPTLTGIQDPVVKTLLEALAAGVEPRRLEQVAASFATGELVQKAIAEKRKPSPSLSWLKGNALREELEAQPQEAPLDPAVEAAIARASAAIRSAKEVG